MKSIDEGSGGQHIDMFFGPTTFPYQNLGNISQALAIVGVLSLILIFVTSYNYASTDGGIVTATTNTTTPLYLQHQSLLLVNNEIRYR